MSNQHALLGLFLSVYCSLIELETVLKLQKMSLLQVCFLISAGAVFVVLERTSRAFSWAEMSVQSAVGVGLSVIATAGRSGAHCCSAEEALVLLKLLLFPLQFPLQTNAFLSSHVFHK